MNTNTISIPLIGDAAPAFKAQTTQGEINFPEDYKGSWVVLFSHPADFTPVCTTEFIAFQDMQHEFEARNTKLLGYSVDGIHSHIAWLRNIKDKFGVSINYPVAAGAHIAHKYGMIHPKSDTTLTVRAVFVISPGGVIASIMYYPLSNGRNIFEIIRLIDSLQISYNNQRATPANWPHNRIYKDKVIVPPAVTISDALDIENKYMDAKDWYIAAENNPNKN